MSVRRLAGFLLPLLAGFLAACDSGRALVEGGGSDPATSGEVEVTIGMGPVGLLARTATMTPHRLHLSLGGLWDTLLPVGTTSVTKTYSLASQRTYTLLSSVSDQNDSTLYSGTASFEVLPGRTTKVKLVLSARFSSLRLRFPVRDSMTRFVLKVDGAVWGDSSVAKQSRVGDTVVMDRDYLAASEAGVEHAVAVRVYGSQWGMDTLLYTLDTNVRLVSGQMLGRSLGLKWVGMNTPPDGRSELSVAFGAMGQLAATVEYEDSATFGSMVDPRDGQSYRTVRIGRQMWMGRNLVYGGAAGTLGVCYNSSTCGDLGRTYTLSEALAGASAEKGRRIQGVCPAGWHLPSSSDWSELKYFVDASGATSGQKLKSSTSPHMNLYAGNGTDDFGFRAYMAGFRKADGTFTAQRQTTVWWASEGASWITSGFSNALSVDTAADPNNGYSVRCLRDS